MTQFVKIKKGAYLIYAFRIANKGWKFSTVTSNERITCYTYRRSNSIQKIITNN